jgi:hypothetical protein
MTLPTTPRAPLGWFHARTVRDAQALSRDSEAFFAVNWLPSASDPVAEIQFCGRPVAALWGR